MPQSSADRRLRRPLPRAWCLMRRWRLFLLVAVWLLPIVAHADPRARLSLRWPFQPGADWCVLQGYNTGSHSTKAYDGVYRYSLDLVLASDKAGALESRTVGQPVVAAADGELLPYLNCASGCYFLRHDARTVTGAYYFTTYIHLEPVLDVSQPAQRHVVQGQLLGTVAIAGQRGSGTVAHLHFGLLSSPDPMCSVGMRTPVPFGTFVSGWWLPTDESANQYGGAIVRQIAAARPTAVSAARPNTLLGAAALAAAAVLTETVPLPAATMTPTLEIVPTATPMPPTATATPPPPTATPLPTAMPTEPPTATRPPAPTAVPSATPTARPATMPTPIPTPTRTPTPVPPNLGPLVSEGIVPYVLIIAVAGLAVLALGRVRL